MRERETKIENGNERWTGWLLQHRRKDTAWVDTSSHLISRTPAGELCLQGKDDSRWQQANNVLYFMSHRVSTRFQQTYGFSLVCVIHPKNSKKLVFGSFDSWHLLFCFISVCVLLVVLYHFSPFWKNPLSILALEVLLHLQASGRPPAILSGTVAHLFTAVPGTTTTFAVASSFRECQLEDWQGASQGSAKMLHCWGRVLLQPCRHRHKHIYIYNCVGCGPSQ